MYLNPGELGGIDSGAWAAGWRGLSSSEKAFYKERAKQQTPANPDRIVTQALKDVSILVIRYHLTLSLI